MRAAPVLRGARVRLSPFGVDRITQRYLGWLSDPLVNEYSRRRDMTVVTHEEAIQYLARLQPEEHVLAIDTEAHGHIGNVKYGPIDRVGKRSDIAIMIGERQAWGKGYGAEAVYLVSRWLFEAEGLARVDAGSGNPAFLRLVVKLGWTIEGVKKAHVRIGDRDLDWTQVALHSEHFRRIPEFDCRQEEQFLSA
jgi:[ribosomal protein S5]-alanine N-acetyltransferase